MKRALLSPLIATIFCSLVFLAFPQNTFAKVVINEFSSAGSDDWIELYNDGQDSVDISMYQLRDSSTNNKLDLDGTISANGFFVTGWNNKLNKDGDIIKLVLKTDENSVIDQVAYGTESSSLPAPSETQSAGRTPNGSANLVVFSVITKNDSNNSASIVPTSTPTPTQTPSPTPTTKPAATNTPTPTLKPTATIAPTNTLVPTRSTTYPTPRKIAGKLSTSDNAHPTAVLAAKTTAVPEKKESKPTPSPEVKVKGESQTPLQTIFMIGMVVLGGVIIGFGGYLYKQSRNSL